MAKQASPRRTSSMRSARVEAPKTTPSTPPPTHAEIAQRAFELYLSRGAADGGDVNDWLRAESELAQTG